MIEVYGCREDDGSEPDIQLEARQGGQLQCPEEKGELKRQPRERAEESAQRGSRGSEPSTYQKTE